MQLCVCLHFNLLPLNKCSPKRPGKREVAPETQGNQGGMGGGKELLHKFNFIIRKQCNKQGHFAQEAAGSNMAICSKDLELHLEANKGKLAGKLCG